MHFLFTIFLSIFFFERYNLNKDYKYRILPHMYQIFDTKYKKRIHTFLKPSIEFTKSASEILSHPFATKF